MLSFVTYFDSRYLIRGLTMYESLCNCGGDFHLYIIAFDSEAYDFLAHAGMQYATIISLDEFEDEELLSVKPSRTRAEYCWTSTAKSILYCMDRFNLDDCTYIDSDLFFYENPCCLINELCADEDVLITEHRYSPEVDQTDASGKYCVQFMFFRNNSNGRKVLNWWKDRCIEWCGEIPSEGRLGDQKYLDDWMERFTGVHELQHLGGGVAPWNVDQYSFDKKEGQVVLTEMSTDSKYPLVFYHFHGVHLFDKDVVKLSSAAYKIPSSAIVYIYKPYFRTMQDVFEKYKLEYNHSFFRNEEHYEGNVDWIKPERRFYRYSMFL